MPQLRPMRRLPGATSRPPGHALRNGGSTGLPTARSKDAARDEQGHQATVRLPLGFATEILPGRALQRRRLYPATGATPSGRALCAAAPSMLLACETGTGAQLGRVPGKAVSGKDSVSVPKLGRRASEGSRRRITSAAGPGHQLPTQRSGSGTQGRTWACHVSVPKSVPLKSPLPSCAAGRNKGRSPSLRPRTAPPCRVCTSACGRAAGKGTPVVTSRPGAAGPCRSRLRRAPPGRHALSAGSARPPGVPCTLGCVEPVSAPILVLARREAASQDRPHRWRRLGRAGTANGFRYRNPLPCDAPAWPKAV
jgi:hypothetical protein